jgi:hypothetical protein
LLPPSTHHTKTQQRRQLAAALPKGVIRFVQTSRVFLLMICTMPSIATLQDRTQKSNRPPVDSDSGMRELTPEEITPNLNYYAMDPLYDPDAVLGWAGTRVEEKINRGMLALNIGDGSVYLGWRLLKSDPEDVAFNVYRSNAGGPAIGLNGSPLTGTTDFIDDGLLPRHKIVQVYNQGSGATRGQPFSQTIVEIFSSESGLPGSRCAR